jgi:hypothetical protein
MPIGITLASRHMKERRGDWGFMLRPEFMREAVTFVWIPVTLPGD